MGKIQVFYFVLLISIFAPMVQVQAESDSSEDVFHFYDKDHKFHIADITFHAELVRNDNSFTLIQSVKLKMIKHTLLEYRIKSMHFDTTRALGLWATGNGTYVGWFITGQNVDESVDIFDQQEITVNQTVYPDEEWNNNNFNIKAQFVNLYFETDEGSINIPISVYFTFSENVGIYENVEADQIVDELEINVWEYLETDLFLLFIIINIVLILYLIFYLYLLYKSKDLITTDLIKMSFSGRHIGEHYEYKTYKLNDFVRNTTISLTIIYVMIKLIISISTLSGTRIITFDKILLPILFLLYFFVPYFFNFYQSIRISPLIQDSYCSEVLWSKKKNILESINTSYKIKTFNVTSLFIFILAPLFNIILENIIVIF
ncbi:MAG: hypothetical protein GPJ54_12720 [Candidatus Heimdallarchaeota archaeon]|nr:hypothetical protein [Candidatus Heimdallarchaeota archaeon]